MPDLLNAGDLYLNFNNETYIEEFGRNVMEAMSYGLPVIAGAEFERVFGDAVLTDANKGVDEIIEALRTDPTLAEETISRGHRFVEENCGEAATARRMEAFLEG